MKTYKDFFVFCEKNNLHDDKTIASAFFVTKQTVKNWRKNASIEKDLPNWMLLAVKGYDYIQSSETHFNTSMPLDWFTEWCKQNNLETLERKGSVFGVTRQAVHAWYHRKRLPRWIVLACLGYQLTTC